MGIHNCYRVCVAILAVSPASLPTATPQGTHLKIKTISNENNANEILIVEIVFVFLRKLFQCRKYNRHRLHQPAPAFVWAAHLDNKIANRNQSYC